MCERNNMRINNRKREENVHKVILTTWCTIFAASLPQPRWNIFLLYYTIELVLIVFKWVVNKQLLLVSPEQ